MDITNIQKIKPYVEKKKSNGNVYYQLVRKAWINGTSKRVWNKYLGTGKTIEKVYDEYEKCTSLKFNSFEYGRTAALMKIAEELNFVEIVNKHTIKKRINGLTVGEYMLLIIISRASEPLSKNKISAWFDESFISIIWSFPHKLNAQNFTNHMEYLTDEVMQKIEDDIGKSLVDKGVYPTHLYIDATNFVTYMKCKKLAAKGESKQKRNDKNIVGLALATSDENIPLFHEAYPGNMQDAKVFSEMFDKIVRRLQVLGVQNQKEKIIAVFDCGCNSSKNVKKAITEVNMVGTLKSNQVSELYNIPLEKYEFLYKDNDGHEIKGHRTKKKLFGEVFLFSWNNVPGNDSERLLRFLKYDIKIEWLENAEIKKSNDNKAITITNESNTLTIKLNKEENKAILCINGKETHEYILKEEGDNINIYYEMDFTIVMRSHPGSYEKQRKTYEDEKKEILEGLEKIKKSVEREGKGRRMGITSAEIASAKVIGKRYKKAFWFECKIKDEKQICEYGTNVEKEKELYLMFGKKPIFTDKHEWSSENIVKTYGQKDFVEKDFHWLKDVLLIPIPPIYLQDDDHIKVHIFLCVMGLVFYRYLMWKSNKLDEKLSGTKVIETLEKIRVVLSQRDDKNVTLKFEEMSIDQIRLFSTLNLGEVLKNVNI